MAEPLLYIMKDAGQFHFVFNDEAVLSFPMPLRITLTYCRSSSSPKLTYPHFSRTLSVGAKQTEVLATIKLRLKISFVPGPFLSR